MEWGTMSTSDLISLINQLSHTPDKSPQRKITKIFNLQLQQIKDLKQTQNPLI